MNETRGETDELLKTMNAKILNRHPGRGISSIDGSRWGELICPSSDEISRHQEGLRVLAICSWTLGLLAFEALKEVQRENPSRMSIVGLVTDDPVEREARISVKRRFWRYYDEDRREKYEEGIIESALGSGIPVYTGEVKIQGFRQLLAKWDPDVIIVAAFGQLIDAPIINYPPLGIYNVHPADLACHHGAGPQPWEDLVARKASTTRTAVHRVSEEIDSGTVIGESPEINVKLVDGSLSEDVRLIGEKTLVPVPLMVRVLAEELIQRKEECESGPVVSLDFARHFSDRMKKELMRPIDPAERGRMVPLPRSERDMDV